MADRDRTLDRTTVTGAIIAGGESTRFGGTPKGLYAVGGVRIVDRVFAALHAVVTDVALVANDPGATGWIPGVPVQTDERSERGSLIGLHTAVGRSAGPVLVVAWDMPFVTSELLALIAGELTDRADAVVPEGPRGLEPMCALYTQRCMPAIDRALGRHELRLGSLVTELPGLIRVPIERVSTVGDPARLFFNVNTPADLELAERIVARR